MRNFDFLAVSDIFLSETAALADVVPPTTQWAEESGIMTNLDGRVILRQAAVTSPGEVRTDLDVIADLAKRVGAQGFSADAQEVFEELGRASQGGKADYGGISCERIAAENGVFWPCPSALHPDTHRLFAEDFPTPDRRAHFHPVGLGSSVNRLTNPELDPHSRMPSFIVCAVTIARAEDSPKGDLTHD